MTTEDLERLEVEQGWNPGTTSAGIQDVDVDVSKLATETLPDPDLHKCRCSLCFHLEDEYKKCTQRMERIAEEICEHTAHRTQARERYGAAFFASGFTTVRGLDFWQTPYQLPHYAHEE
jgi:nucleotidyltransferase/DNA polymerase involved in DNA repair